ncbi:amidohydrolase family protein [Opitutus sp. GAS368]|jgi:imidazolonepropionase-like amidohydrolase|uniref:amidohydrolase family protein n=1 Tax=Opitutus sp. GAS368 TaxID=1882749 RepID=UPI00087A17D8|nr:amidohydrolase family protein [Opitutus sp. GAS368]SDR95406.1 Imidazolonepropionase [Opitutus sp. GAS368]
MHTRPLLCLAAVLGLAASLGAQEKTQVFKGAQIIPIAGEPIANGVFVVVGGKIVAVGAADKVPIPAGAEIHDATGKVLMPGLIDSHSHIGAGSGGDGSGPIQPDARVLDSLDARDASIQKARAGGITTVNVMPGSGHLISGQTLYLKLRSARVVDDLLIKLPDGTNAGGLKMANGTNSMKGANGFPGTRAKSAALVREEYIKAQEYRDKIKRANGDPEKMPPRDLALEEIVEVLDGKRIVQNHTHRHDDILTVLRLSKEFGFKVVLHHVSEGWKVADEIAAAHAPCSVIMIDSPGGKLETRDADWRTPAILEKAGVLVGFHTDDPITDSRLFIRSAALAVRAGMTRKGALEAVTIANAKILGLDARVGSLEPGKDADFILLSGDPLSVYTHVEETWVEGKKVFDRSRPEDHLYAVGGPGAGDSRRAQLCCFTSAWDLIAAANGGDQ